MKLKKTDFKELEKQFNAIQSRIESLEGFINDLNVEIADRISEFKNDEGNNLAYAIELINEEISEFQGLTDDLHNEQLSKYEDRSESFQESEKGEQCQEWIDELEQFKDGFEATLTEATDPVIDKDEIFSNGDLPDELPRIGAYE